ncbi:hypothetical protein GSI_00109 [Ganoderma sinense ZZ0214-1]|uniref:Uncharacterized protein n=1 Tax=Ganoderma sinense ZZ0214-1 TaxID=1077348 RepID=A0A2G8SRL0_9APHY|nr:hypothetical protein GSI_00109 [Ganoderma sinense ZZ0214-1]
MQGRDTLQTPPSRSPAQSRAASPLRNILHGWNLHRNHTRDERFIPPDPFSSHIRWFGFRREHSPTRPLEATPPYVPASPAFSPKVSHTTPKPPLWSRVATAVCAVPARKGADEDEDEKPRKKRNAWRRYLNDASFFFTYTLPRIVYLNFLLHLPALYWQRVARVFEDAELSKPEIERLIDACGDFAHDPSVDAFIAAGFTTPTNNAKPLPNGLPYPEEWTPPTVSPALARFKISWENFVDTLMREWKTFNLVSALLTTGILTIFQIQDAAGDPVTRWTALFSLIFAIMSLSFGCVYIVHFGTMRSMDRASRWAEEARKTRATVLWNIWVLLATPAIWLAWSMIAFCIAIMSFVWRTGSEADANGYPPLTKGQALGVRVAMREEERGPLSAYLGLLWYSRSSRGV